MLQLNKLALPTFFSASLDYLPIQASAVSSEHVFSSSAETDTKKRNRIKPVLMEALQMLKFALKQSHLDFTKNWATPKSLMEEQEQEPERDLTKLLGQHSEDILDIIIQDIGDNDDA